MVIDASQSAKSGRRISVAWGYLLLAFALTWLVWIPGTRLHLGEMILAFGAAGPALAAMWMVRAGNRTRPQTVHRILCFAGVWLVSFIVLEAFPLGVPTLEWPIHWNPQAIALALLPAWILSAAWSPDSGIRTLMRSLLVCKNWRWPVISLLAIPAYLLVPAAVARVAGLPLVVPPHRDGYGSLLPLAVFSFARNILFTAVLEEPGWRGVLLHHLEEKRTPLVASLFVWLPWMLWHLPLDLTGGAAHTVMAWLEIRVIFLIPMTILLTWIYNRSGGSLLCTALFHASLNTFPFVLPYSPPMLGLVFVWVIWVVVHDRMWRTSTRTTS